MTAWEQWRGETMDRQLAVIESLRPRPADPETEACARWTAVQRQASSYLRHLEPQLGAGKEKPNPAAVEVVDHFRHLAESLERARAEVEACGTAARAAARAAMGIRLAVMGKGGAGKTFISSVLARSLARSGRRVLAVDLDVNPGLAVSLGLAPTEAGLPCEAVEAHPGAPYGWQLAGGLSPLDAVERFAVEGPDGVRYLGLGKVGSLDKEAPRRSIVALVHILLGFGWPGWDVVADMEAGPTTPFERYHSFSDEVMVVVGPAWRSAMTARRLLTLVGPRRAAIVANRFSDGPDHPGLAPLARVPFDAAVVEAERLGLAPFDACPGAPAVRAVCQLADRYTTEEVCA